MHKLPEYLLLKLWVITGILYFKANFGIILKTCVIKLSNVVMGWFRCPTILSRVLIRVEQVGV